MKLKRIQNRPLRLLIFAILLPVVIYACCDFWFDTDELKNYLKKVWVQNG